MSYIVSARKYRPKTFGEVVGQQAVTRILEKAIETKRLAQALLFTGPRGVGKTSCARIMAREVNKEFLDNPDADLSFNIFELDAASNNSVDDIRELIEQVRIPPHIGKYKVYIIDEVHMLSTQAFNAFLKTLEEPPEHAIFILATTEKHKIPATILSRCQIFDFKRISTFEIKEHLKKIASLEGIEAEDEALNLIALKADGALRDALSAFDKIISLGGKKITRKMVSDYLGIPDYRIFFDFTRYFSEGNKTEVLLLFDRLVGEGMDIHHFIGGLASHLRDLLVASDRGTQTLLEIGEEIAAEYRKQAAAFDKKSLMQAIDLTVQVDLQYKSSQNPRLLTEITLLKLVDLLAPDNVEKKKTENLKKEPPPTEKTLDKTQTPVQQEKRLENPSGNNIKSREFREQSAEYSPDKPQSQGGFSLKKMTSLKAEKTRSNQAFSQEDFNKIWEEILETYRQNQEINKFNLLRQARPEVNGNIITVHFDCNVKEKEFDKLSPSLMQTLKARLKNDYIEFRKKRIRVKEKEEARKALTKPEILELMAKKNPHIKTIVQIFDLRFKT